MAVLKLQYSDKGGVMTKIMGNHTGDHNIQLFKLNRNAESGRLEWQRLRSMRPVPQVAVPSNPAALGPAESF